MSSFFGADRREALAQRGDQQARLVDQPRAFVCVMYATRASAGTSSDSASPTDPARGSIASGCLARRPHNLLVARVPDQDHGRSRRAVRTACACACTFVTSGHVASIAVSLQRERRSARTRRRDAVSRKDDRRARAEPRSSLVDEDRPARLEVAHDVDVVDDLLAHVHRSRRTCARALARPSRPPARRRRSSPEERPAGPASTKPRPQ